MAGRVSEESGEAYNGALKVTKNVLSAMRTDRSRISKITERQQGNLKGEVMMNRLKIEETRKGKKRGPYKATVQTRDNRSILRDNEVYRMVDNEWYVVLDSRSYLPKDCGSRGGRRLKIGWIASMQLHRVTSQKLIGKTNETAVCYS